MKKRRSGKRITQACEYCGKEFEAMATAVRQGGGRFCCQEHYHANRSKDKAGLKERNRFYQKKTKYGVTREDYEEMLVTQDGKCKICNKMFGNEHHNRPHVDHRHVDGKVRGLLCSKCNSLISFANESKEILEEAVKYLRE